MEYIENLANNYPEIDKPIQLDIIIEGGLFNGMYSCGALLLIKQLERKKYFQVGKIFLYQDKNITDLVLRLVAVS